MSRPVIFDLFHTLIQGADEERDRVVGEMAVMVGVAPAAGRAQHGRSGRGRETASQRRCGDDDHCRRAADGGQEGPAAEVRQEEPTGRGRRDDKRGCGAAPRQHCPFNLQPLISRRVRSRGGA